MYVVGYRAQCLTSSWVGFRAKAGVEVVSRANGAAPGSYVAVHLADVPADVAMRLVQRVQAASQVPSLLTPVDSFWRRITMFASRLLFVDCEHPVQLLHGLHPCYGKCPMQSVLCIMLSCIQ